MAFEQTGVSHVGNGFRCGTEDRGRIAPTHGEAEGQGDDIHVVDGGKTTANLGMSSTRSGIR